MNNLIDLEILRQCDFIFFDFDGVFTDNSVIVSEEGKESVKCSRADGIGLNLLNSVNVGKCVVSTETNKVVYWRAKKLNLECNQAIENKGEFLKKYTSNNNIKLKNCAFVGNDINDLPALKIVGIPIGVADSHPSIREYLKLILKTKGGHGAVREICELIYKSKKTIS